MDTVLVTGASGFIGAHCILELLRAGYQVRASVRSQTRKAALFALLCKHMPNTSIECVTASLDHNAGWDKAVAGCTYVLHLVSPLPTVQPKEADELIRLARDGALRVLKAALQAGVKRLVMTSSQAAVCGSRVTCPEHVYNEDDRTDLDDPSVSSYNRSKTIAERAARDFVAENGGIEFVTVNPGLVCGPVLESKSNTSLEFVKRLLDGSLFMIPPVGYEVVDVRDVAVLHRLAMEHPDAAGGRFMASSEFLWLHDMAAILRDNLGNRAKHVTSRRAPIWLMRGLALFDPATRSILPDLNQYRPVDHSTATRLLGWEPRPAKQTVIATAESLLNYRVVR
ncbi:MAG: aldehyde reductase [Chloroflexales bacterium]|nr:aldehyde reductase [Chloroflexales bacterium]